MYRVDTLERDDSHPEKDRGGQHRLHLGTQNSTQFKTSELFVSENFHLTFLDHG